MVAEIEMRKKKSSRAESKSLQEPAEKVARAGSLVPLVAFQDFSFQLRSLAGN